MGDFTAKIDAWCEKAETRLERADTNFKLKIANRIVAGTRIAQPMLWKRPDPSHVPGTLRGNWIVETPQRKGYFDPTRKNTTHYLDPSEMRKISKFSTTILANYTPYAMVYERIDGMVGKAAAAMMQDLQITVEEVKND